MAIALFIAGRIAQVDQMDVLRANMPFLWGILAFLPDRDPPSPRWRPGCRLLCAIEGSWKFAPAARFQPRQTIRARQTI